MASTQSFHPSEKYNVFVNGRRDAETQARENVTVVGSIPVRELYTYSQTLAHDGFNLIICK